MRKLLSLAIACALMGAGCMPATTPPAQAPAPTPAPATPPTEVPSRIPAPTKIPVQSKVDIKDNAFSPQVLNVEPGTTVIWTNTGKSNHTVNGTGGVLLWDSGNLSPGMQYKRVFDQPGIYDYSCGLHAEMKGQIIVGKVIQQIP